MLLQVDCNHDFSTFPQPTWLKGGFDIGCEFQVSSQAIGWHGSLGFTVISLMIRIDSFALTFWASVSGSLWSSCITSLFVHQAFTPCALSCSWQTKCESVLKVTINSWRFLRPSNIIPPLSRSVTSGNTDNIRLWGFLSLPILLKIFFGAFTVVALSLYLSTYKQLLSVNSFAYQ